MILQNRPSPITPKMDDRTNIALYAIERKIERSRDAQPCDEYDQTSQHLPHCRNCGLIHDEEREIRR